MKIIRNIVHTELRLLFSSPVGWLVIILFSLQSGNEFVSHISREISSVANGGHLINQTAFTFARYDTRLNRESGVFAEMQRYLFLYIPLLTMGAISKEVNSGTFKLLQSSPVTKWQITLGKFTALAILGLLLMSLLLIGFWIDSYCVQGLDFALFCSGLLGLWLLLCAYAAVGLFISTCSQNQPVAALLTFIVLMTLSYIGAWGQPYEIMRAVSKLLNITSYSDDMLNGIMSINGILYFISVTIFFITMATFRLQTSICDSSMKALMIILILVLTVIFVIAESPSTSVLSTKIDVTKNKSQSLTSASEKIAREIHGTLKIHTYANILGPFANYAYPSHWNDNVKVFDHFQNIIPKIQQDYTLYYDTTDDKFQFSKFAGKTSRQVAMKMAYKDGVDFSEVLTPAQALKRVYFKNEEGRLFRVLEYRGKTARLRTFDARTPLQQPQEEDIAIALKQLLVPAPKIFFLSGNGERRIDSKADSDIYYATYAAGERDALRNKGFHVDTLNLNTCNLPAGVCALVLADPDIPFDTKALRKLQDYINSGGNLVIMGEVTHSNVLSPVLTDLGLRMEGQIYQTDRQYLPDQIGARFSGQAIAVDTTFKNIKLSFPGLSYHVDTAVVSMAGAAALQIMSGKNFKAVPVLLTDTGNSYYRQAIDPSVMLTGKFNPDHSEQKQLKNLAIALSREVKGKQQRIMVIGDADWFTQREIERRDDGSANVDFYTGIFNWLSNGAFPVSELRKDETNTLNVKQSSLLWLQLIYFGLLPGSLLVAGLITLYKRKIA